MTETPIEMKLRDVQLTITFTEEGRDVKFSHEGSGFNLPDSPEELEVIKEHFDGA